ncbi:MAG: hypothetical protein ABSE39_12840 [Candidatus Bathyarchaeia archaeon]
MAESKVSPEMIDELLRTGRLVFLQTAGCTAAEIAGFGDLVRLPEEKMQELLHNKTEKTIASLLGEATLKHDPRILKLHGKKKSRR